MKYFECSWGIIFEGLNLGQGMACFDTGNALIDGLIYFVICLVALAVVGVAALFAYIFVGSMVFYCWRAIKRRFMKMKFIPCVICYLLVFPIFLPLLIVFFPFRNASSTSGRSIATPVSRISVADVAKTVYHPRPIMNSGEARVFYKIKTWVKRRDQNEHVFVQVPMGVYLKPSNKDDDAYRRIFNWRPDYLVVGSEGLPICVVEFQGDGHYGRGVAERDVIKKDILKSVGIPLIEIFPDEAKDDQTVWIKLDQALAPASSAEVALMISN